MKRLKQFQRIEVFWLDSCHDSGWQKLSEIKWRDADVEYQTTGYFLKENKHTIALCQSKRQQPYTDGDQIVDAIMEIPKKAIVKVTKL